MNRLIVNLCYRICNMHNRIVCLQDKNNNAIDSTTTTKGDKSNKKKKTPKSANVRKIETKHARQDDANDKESPRDAKRQKVDNTADIVDIVPAKTIEKDGRHHEASTSTASVSSASSTLSNASSNDSVIVIGDDTLESSIANTTASTIKSDSSASTSRQNRSNRADNYNFDVLQTDDETDEEDNTPYAPQWSKSKIRSDQVIDQEQMDPNIIDQFFGCRAETVDLKAIFPYSAPIARRRSTAVWNTPPRYSMLPKY